MQGVGDLALDYPLDASTSSQLLSQLSDHSLWPVVMWDVFIFFVSLVLSKHKPPSATLLMGGMARR